MPFLSPIVECRVASLKHVNGELIDVVVFNGSGRIVDLIAISLVDLAADNLIGIAVYRKVRIMRHDHHLTTRTGLSDALYEQTNYRFVIEIVLGLVDNDRNFFSIKQQVEDE